MGECARERLVMDLAIECLRKSGKLRFRVQGTSMMPTIRPGSSVTVRRVEPGLIQTGDIILIATAAGLRLHRVIANVPQLITRGDNHAHDDPPVGAEQVLGKLDRIEPEPWRFAHILRRAFA